MTLASDAQYPVLTPKFVLVCRYTRAGQLPQRLAGTIDFSIPRLLQGCCFLDWLLARRLRGERALTTVAPARSLDQADGEAVRTTLMPQADHDGVCCTDR